MNNEAATRQGEADDERKEGNRDRCGSRHVSGKVVERLWKDNEPEQWYDRQ